MAEETLASEIKETNEQEITTQKAQAAANTARLAVFKATLASHKAFEAYMNTMTSDALDYSKAWIIDPIVTSLKQFTNTLMLPLSFSELPTLL